jgi:cell division protein FtsW
MLLPIGPVIAVAIGFVLLGKDLGTATIMFAIVLGALFFAGARLRLLFASLVVSVGFAVLFSMTSENRQNRIQAWLDGCQSPRWAALQCYQTLHGWWALADGGVFGVGLGNSRGKWNWIPEADNDFIFSIIGEELGLVGAVLVVLLFAVLAFAFIRIIRMQRDRFPMLVTAGVMVWIIAQAFVNIAVVLGLLPVLGVPLPLISKGGTALITTLAAIGVVLSFARRRPEPLPRGAATR